MTKVDGWTRLTGKAHSQPQFFFAGGKGIFPCIAYMCMEDIHLPCSLGGVMEYYCIILPPLYSYICILYVLLL